MSLLKKVWKESASLIICGRNANNAFANGANYKILVMKRSSRASFMPNFVVFPGGAIEPADSRPEWLTSLRQMGVPDDRFAVLRTEQKQRPFIFDHTHPIHGGDENVSAIDRNISLRLSAIRETFEEVGIFIGQSATGMTSKADQSGLAVAYDLADAKQWQDKVHANASTLLELCTGQHIVPNLWCLFEWANWLTPTTFPKKRFDTAFYLSTLENQPPVLVEPSEVQEYLWASPGELLRMYAEHEVEFAPPQFYELCRLSRINDIVELQRFARHRQKLGTTLYYPLCYVASDGVVFVYPGDDLYPELLDFVGDAHDINQFSALRVAELRARSNRLHRMEHGHPTTEAGRFGMVSHQTVESIDGHLSPLPNVRHRL